MPGRSAALHSCVMHSLCVSTLGQDTPCLLKGDFDGRHYAGLLTFNAVASGSASCVPVGRSKPICKLSRYGFSRSLLVHTWSFTISNDVRQSLCMHDWGKKLQACADADLIRSQ